MWNEDTMKWEEALKLIEDDKRFNRMDSAGQRKQIFSEWLTQAKKRAQEI